MLSKNTVLSYAFLLITSSKSKSFESLGRQAKLSGDTIARRLQSEKVVTEAIKSIALRLFWNSRKIFFIIDDTLIKKLYATMMAGTGYFYDQKTGRRITAFRLVIGVVSDGKYSIPVLGDYLLDNELCDLLGGKRKSAIDIAKQFIKELKKLFCAKKFVVVVDGLYATKDFLLWCITNGIAAEMRMHKNRVVEYKGKRIKLSHLTNEKGIIRNIRQIARTITVTWHDMELEVTVVRRIDKHDQETIIYQAATYKACPQKHVENYKHRWPVECIIRTSKQRGGINDCSSPSFQNQRNHIANVFLAIALAQLEAKRLKLKNIEAAFNSLEGKKWCFFEQRFSWLLQDNQAVYA